MPTERAMRAAEAVQYLKKYKVRAGCDYCQGPATIKYLYLLENYRSNPASTAYRRDDCSRCSDLDIFTCSDCKPEPPVGYNVHPSKISFGGMLDHLFFVEKTEEIEVTLPALEAVAEAAREATKEAEEARLLMASEDNPDVWQALNVIVDKLRATLAKLDGEG